MNTQKIVNLLLRMGVAFAFLFPAINAVFDPLSWIGYFPKFLHGVAPDLVLLHGFGIVEVVIALWILSGKRILVPSLLAMAMLFSIVLLNLQDFHILFRDLVIALTAGALALGARDNNS